MFGTVPYKPFTPTHKILLLEPLQETILPTLSAMWVDAKLSVTSGMPAAGADIDVENLEGRSGMWEE